MDTEIKYTVLMILAVIAAIFVGSSIYTIQAGERGVLLTFGKPSMDSVGEGLHFKWTLTQSIKKFEVKTQKVEANSDASSKDLQDVQTVIALNYHIDPSKVPVMYQEVGNDYVERIINPAIQESVKSVQATFTAEELVTVRPEVKDKIEKQLIDRLAKYYIIVDDFNIINFQFSPEFDLAIEAKVTAEQQALAAKNKLEQIKYEAQQAIAAAEGKAKAIQIESDALKENEGIITLRAIEKWDGRLPTVTGGATPFIDIAELA